MGHQQLNRLLLQDLDQRREAHLYRERRIVDPIDATHLTIQGRRYINFASNNYLGLTHHPRMVAAACEAIKRYGAGSGAAGLISGYFPEHVEAERAIAQWKGYESAVLLPSGYQANCAAVQTLAALSQQSPGGLRFLLDKLVHASLVDAVRATGLPFRVFPHNHMGKLKRLLDEADASELQVVVTESIFSMDGDAADLHGLAELKGEGRFVLMLDEAHSSGIYGSAGAGLAVEYGLTGLVDVCVVTLSKAMGGMGGAICAAGEFCQSLVNHGRAYIYSTAVSPSMAATARTAIDILRDEPQRQQRLRELALRVRERLSKAGLAIGEGNSPIIPIVLGAEQDVLRAADRLREQGLLVGAVRPPTVPRGGSRLRVTLSCEHTDSEIDALVNSVTRWSSRTQ